ncbi:MAG TPA: CHAD domain-containing protein [Candidatus Hydrogenedentes bacterium]|nr:CHAD domain-containing protein [Candidatus Hydrogenedentota bacterium]HOS01810.1 CHAD domain-containing protein [Candidatus Hydrogenedentota bacterium]
MAKRCVLALEAASRLVRARAAMVHASIEAARAEDPDGIHDLRVASRRLRAALVAHRKVFMRGTRRPVTRRARAITKALGKPRELDVTIALLEKRRRRDGSVRAALAVALRRLRAERKALSASVAEGASAAAFREFELALVDLFLGMRPPRTCYLKEAARALCRRYSGARAVYLLWRGMPSEETLHCIRICLKKLRYACELYVPLYEERMDVFVAALKELQDLLGTWNDRRLARDHVRRVLASASPAPTGTEALLAELDQEAADCLRAFGELGTRFFAAERAHETRAFFEEPTWACCRDAAPADQQVEAAYGE